MVIHTVNQSVMANPLATAMALVALSFLFFCFMKESLFNRRRWSSDQLPPVPKVLGLPLLGNLLQLKEKKPFKAYPQWAEIYGPIYSIKPGSSQVIVLSDTQLAKEFPLSSSLSSTVASWCSVFALISLLSKILFSGIIVSAIFVDLI
ncbi:hypothetical protein Nepgr_009543 [Nepenthes gracilis]|uniref:Cytochrome P450 n=1 Tax=Nepenthes gracilis TaxID=150966 RepID=A0AAD3SAP7_NEPGR|nr:hypothetical protein Nepgr_009543 [Nepenthes gracilis]